MELVQHVIKEIVTGDNVRMGLHGSLPIFSISQSINVVTKRKPVDGYGSLYVNTTLKEKHPALFSQIIYHKFPDNPNNTPCMDMFGLLKTLSVVKSGFSEKMAELGASGILLTEAGDSGLLAYVLQNSSINDSYRRILRQIIWAEKNKDDALRGVQYSTSDYVGERFQVFIASTLFYQILILWLTGS
jgi:hypothetical protein